jgi:hypothetical protein
MLQQSKKTTGRQRFQRPHIVSMFAFLCIVMLMLSFMSNRHPELESGAKLSSASHYEVDRKPFYDDFRVFVEDVISNLRLAPVLENDSHALHVAFPRASMNGHWVEFGVFSGGTIRTMSNAYRGPGAVYGFDSFEGLPEDWRSGLGKGLFDMKGNPPFEETEKIKWVKGWYDKSIPLFVQNRTNEKITFIHVDCDLYSATKTVFKELDAWLEPGVVIVFDELINYPGYRDHEIKALFELLQDRRDLGFRIIGTSTRDVQLDVQRESQPQAAAIQLCVNGNLDCTLSDDFAVFEKFSAIQRNV